MCDYPDYNRILIEKWKKLTMDQISTLEKERCWLIIHKTAYFEKNKINPALLNKLGHLPAELQYYNDQLEKYDRMIYNMNREMNWIREIEDGCQGKHYKGNISDYINDFAREFGYWKD